MENYRTNSSNFFLSLTWCDFYLIIFRSASPRHGFTIMNRLSMENRTEPITKDLDFQLQDPFLLYRNARCKYVICWVKYWRSQLLQSLFFVKAVQMIRLQLSRAETSWLTVTIEGIHFGFWRAARIAQCFLKCHSSEVLKCA